MSDKELTLDYIIKGLRTAESDAKEGLEETFLVSGKFAGRVASVLEEMRERETAWIEATEELRQQAKRAHDLLRDIREDLEVRSHMDIRQDGLRVVGLSSSLWKRLTALTNLVTFSADSPSVTVKPSDPKPGRARFWTTTVAQIRMAPDLERVDDGGAET